MAIDPGLLSAGASFLGSAASAGSTASAGPQWQGLHFGSYGSIGSPGLFTGAAAGGSAGGGSGGMSGLLMVAAGVALLWALAGKRGK